MLDNIIGNKVIGYKQCLKFMNNGKGTSLYIAKNADKKIITELTKIANGNGVKLNYFDSMKNLGKKCGIEVKTSSTLLLD